MDMGKKMVFYNRYARGREEGRKEQCHRLNHLPILARHVRRSLGEGGRAL